MFKQWWQKIFPKPNDHKFAGKSILIIEDTVGEQVLYSRSLQKKGYKVTVTSNGAEGVQAAAANNFDLILLDFLLPDGTGAEICQRLKELDATKEVPVIILTSKDSPKSVIDCYDAGASYYLAKPVSAGTLLHQVELTLEEKNLK